MSQLTAATAAGQPTTFAYDALGRRIRESKAQGSAFYVWDGASNVALGPDTDVSQAQLRVAASMDDTLALVGALGSGSALYVHPGTDGSALATTDASGALVEAYSYSAYGETTAVDGAQKAVARGSLRNRFLYQGQLYDADLALYSMRAREFKPAWGRFLSPDPIGIDGGLNLYAFVDGRPLTFRDPFGLSAGGNRAWDRINQFYFPPGMIGQSFLGNYDIATSSPSALRRYFAALNTESSLAPLFFEEAGRGLLNVPWALMAGPQTVLDTVHNWSAGWSWDYKIERLSQAVGASAMTVGAAIGAGSIAGAGLGMIGGSTGRLPGDPLASPGNPLSSDSPTLHNLGRHLAGEEAVGAFTATGELSSEASEGARQIFAPGELGNPDIPMGFGKWSTDTFNSPSGPFQVHFYRNPMTGEIYYGIDYKAVFNRGIVPYSVGGQ